MINSANISVIKNANSHAPADSRAIGKAADFGANFPGYTGPKDGQSRPAKFKWLMRPINRALVAGLYRIDITGLDHLPRRGAQVYSPTHSNFFDPLVMGTLSKRDMRYMASIHLFRGVMGKVLSWTGAFPVNRGNVDPRTREHSIDILKQGAGLCLFPEGGIPDEERNGQVGKLKRGAADFALKGGAESVVPIAIRYQPDTESRPITTAIAAASAALVLAGSALAAIAGGPVAKMVAATIGGAACGGYGLGKIAKRLTHNTVWCNPCPKYIAGLIGGGIGIVAGGVLAGFTSLDFPSVAPLITAFAGATGAVSAYKLVLGWRDRDLAKVVVAQPLIVNDYRNKYGETDAVTPLTADLRRSIGKTLEQISGTPYQEEISTTSN